MQTMQKKKKSMCVRVAWVGTDEIRMDKMQEELLKSRNKYQHKQNLKTWMFKVNNCKYCLHSNRSGKNDDIFSASSISKKFHCDHISSNSFIHRDDGIGQDRKLTV